MCGRTSQLGQGPLFSSFVKDPGFFVCLFFNSTMFPLSHSLFFVISRMDWLGLRKQKDCGFRGLILVLWCLSPLCTSPAAPSVTCPVPTYLLYALHTLRCQAVCLLTPLCFETWSPAYISGSIPWVPSSPAHSCPSLACRLLTHIPSDTLKFEE